MKRWGWLYAMLGLLTGVVLGQRLAQHREQGPVQPRRATTAEADTLSAISLLRHIQREQPLPDKVVQVTGFPDLWRVCPDAEGLARMIFGLFFEWMNWLQNQNPYIYFIMPDEVTFSDAAHLYLRLSPDLYADMTVVFGHLRQISSDHYHHNFTVSQV